VRLREDEFAAPRPAIRASIEVSLKRLGRDRVDVLHLHNPIVVSSRDRRSMDLHLALGEVGRGLQDVVDAGLAGHAGFTGLGDSTAVREVVANPPYETVQAYFNALNPSGGYTGHAGGQQDFEGLIDTAARAERGVIVIRVLAAGAAAAAPQ